MSSTPSIPDLYNSRAETYDDKTTFHRRLAEECVQYANPQPGESLLDLACGTGLVTFAFAPILQPQLQDNNGTGGKKGKIVGVDISSGMLSIAREKLRTSIEKGKDFEIEFVEHDITDLGGVEELRGMEGRFNIITICSAMVLLDEPGEALKNWVKHLKIGGRVVLDVPHPRSMLALKILSDIAPSFSIPMLGNRSWITGPDSLSSLMSSAGLDTKVITTGEYEDIPARTQVIRSKGRRGIWRGDEGGRVFDVCAMGSGWMGLGEEERESARWRFGEGWEGLADGDERGEVREEGRLFVGVGVKR
jgi:ubiquinone/menaquinone biosynthesis C-methylase UbiE